MRSSSLVLVTFIRSHSLLALVLGLSLLPAGCFRSRMLNAPKTSCPPGATCNSTAPKNGDASVKRDGPGDGRLGDGDSLRDGSADGSRDGLRDGTSDAPGDGGLRDGTADTPGDGLRDGTADAPRDGLRDGIADARTEVPSDSRVDGTVDGVRDGVADATREARLDSPSERPTDAVVCGPVEICGNGLDDDCNGVSDCVDPACQNLPACINHKKELCNNGIDDDGNGLVDCNDPACFGDKACAVPGIEICNNNLDDDDDGLVDCKDPDCATDPTCIATPGDEICDNGKDDNGDGLVDCTDPKCKTFPACLQAACTEDVDFGSIASSGTSISRPISTVGAAASYRTCAPPGGVARVAGFSLAAAADVRMDFTQDKASAHVVALFRAGVGQACDANPVSSSSCLDVRDNASATQTYNSLAPGNYWLVVQSYAGTPGSTTVTLSTGKTGTTEICDNGKDDDGDGAIDCADLDCASAANCNLCKPDINLGAIVVGGGTKTTTFDTTTTSNRYHPSCTGSSTGNDTVIHFSVKETVGLSLAWQQTGDHSYDLLDMPPPGSSCVTGKEHCGPMDGSSGITDWSFFTPGDYLLIFKATAAGTEGKITVSLTAYANRGVEICNNGIDDDGNGLVDCDDPNCFGVSGCSSPLCQPDGDLGNIDIGTRTSVHIDLTTATQIYQSNCSKGNGVGRAYRVNLLSPMVLDFFCTETGDQVFDISPQLSPLDRCDAHASNCADPTLGNLGCNFGMPSLQPGTYYILVEAFDSGTAGTVDLTLQGEEQRILEICNNGIDDDGDGAIDCNDRKCATDISCRAQSCRPDKQLGLLAIDGTTVLSAALTTIGMGDDQTKSTCVSGPGGADTVVSFSLPGKTDLTIEWAQFGNHALVLYQADNAPVPCEANTLIDCKATAGAAMGTYVLKGLAAGKYYLVVDADKAGSEGGLALQLTGLPATP